MAERGGAVDGLGETDDDNFDNLDNLEDGSVPSCDRTVWDNGDGGSRGRGDKAPTETGEGEDSGAEDIGTDDEKEKEKKKKEEGVIQDSLPRKEKVTDGIYTPTRPSSAIPQRLGLWAGRQSVLG